MGIGKQIRRAREQLGLTQGQLAKAVGVTKSAIGNYESGVSHPKEPVLYALFEALGCDANFLFQGHYPPQAALQAEDRAAAEHLRRYQALDRDGRQLVDLILEREYSRITGQETNILTPDFWPRLQPQKQIPFYALPASAGTGVYLDGSDSEPISVPASSEADFALRVSGDSMWPDYNDGDILLIKQQPSVLLGELGIFVLDGEGFFKKYAGDYLVSLNPRYADIPLSRFENITCSGRVLGKLHG